MDTSKYFYISDLFQGPFMLAYKGIGVKVEMSRTSHYATCVYLYNQSAWDKIEPATQRTKDRPTKGFEKKGKQRVKLVPEEKSRVKEKSKHRGTFESPERGRELIKNPIFSLTSFLIPLCITGDRKDYQLLYCICALKNAIKIMSTTLRKEGFAQLYMVGMKSEVDWEAIKQNNTTFSDIIIDFLIKSGTVCMVAANKKEVISKVHSTDAPFVVLLSATDITMPCQANLCVGTCWMIFRRTEESRKSLFDREAYNCGRRALHSGLVVNGCNTIMACAFKRVGGIHYFMFDMSSGDFKLKEDGCFTRHNGNLLSVNEGLFYKFDPNVREWLLEKKANKDGNGYCPRYTGGWVTDCYRILRSGGLLLSPADSEITDGRVKYLCKAVPLSYLAEKAGGKASNGRISIFKAKAKKPRNTNIVLGSIGEVDEYLKRTAPPSGDTFLPEHDTDNDDTSTDLDL